MHDDAKNISLWIFEQVWDKVEKTETPQSPWHSKSPDKLIQMDLCVIVWVVTRRWQGSKVERLVQNRGVEFAATDTDGAAHHSRHGEDSQQDSPPVSLQGQTRQTTVEQLLHKPLSSHWVFLHYSSLDYCWLYFLARCLASYLEKFPSVILPLTGAASGIDNKCNQWTVAHHFSSKHLFSCS